MSDGSRESFTWVSATGDSTDLAMLADGLSGRFMPPVVLTADIIPGQPGGQLRQARLATREVALPFIVDTPDEADKRLALRALMRLFNPLAGDGVLRCELDGNSRDLSCRYAGGLALDESSQTSMPTFQKTLIILRAHDPFWYDTDPATTTYTTGTATTFLGTPFLPIHLASDTVLGEQTVTNDGDVETWPVWTIAGPATAITLTNVTTGAVIDLPITLTAGQSVTIDTRPFRKTVRRDDGTNLYGNLAAGSALWSLPEGPSTINVEVSGSTVDSFVTLVYYRRYLSP